MAKPLLTDPSYPALVTGIQADQAGAARNYLADHEQDPDPHPQYGSIDSVRTFAPRPPRDRLFVDDSQLVIASQVFGY